MQVSLIFSLLFFIAFIMYLFFGIYIFHTNSGTGLNRVFFAICLSLCLWSLGFSVAVSAPTWEVCFLWRRVSAIGWGTIYSLLLHYLLLLTAKPSSKKPRVYHILLYIPAILSVAVFGISEELGRSQYNLIKTDLGWASVAIQNTWFTVFYVYYIGYALTCLVLLWRWKKNNLKDHDIRKQADLILMSLIAALLLGSVTDVILSAVSKSPLPQMAPIFILLPVWAIYYSMKHYNLMGSSDQEENNLLLNHETHLKMQHYLGLSYLAGGASSALAYYFPHLVNNKESMQTMLYGGLVIFFIGIAILLAQLIKIKKVKDEIILVAMLCSIPVITMQFVEYAGITIWVFPVVLIVASLVFNSRKHLILLTTAASVTQIFVWVHAPKGEIQIDEFDYILRISIFLILFMVGSFVHKTYVKRMEENSYQINFQKLISEISADFVSINPINMNEKLAELLNKMGHFFLVDRTYIFLIDRQKNTMTRTHDWRSQGISLQEEPIQDDPVDTFPWWMEELTHKKLVYVEDVSVLSEKAAAEKESLTKQGVKSSVALPIEQDGAMLGFIGLDSVVSTKKWSVYHIELLRILSHLIADGLIRVTSEKAIEHMAYYDHLTELPNRILFSDRLSQAIHLAERNRRFLGVLFLDLDGFKMVNDTMGHRGGDDLLKEISQRLVSHLRKTDTVARFGGDEFLILINNLRDEEDIMKTAELVMSTFIHPFKVFGQEFYVSASAGVAMYPFDGEDTETLIKNADTAMYMAKERGKNQYVLCTSDMKEEVRRKSQLSSQLRQAQEREELILYYQPQVKLCTGKIVGLEALLRWSHPELGMIPPAAFIPLAEMNGTINSIGEWVLKTAINQNKKWQEKGFPAVRIAVNLSAVQFNNPGFVDRVISILNEAGMDSKYLELEITESVATKESSYIIDALNQLKEFGVSISIDDFGTEYSSLNRIKTLPIDRIKIDMQFIQGIEGCEKDQAITKVIINLAKSLDLEVLAEGVETAPQMEFLNQKMCDEVQGYYFYKPMPAEEIEKIFRMQALEENDITV